MHAQLVERSHADYVITTDRTRLDLDLIHRYLTTSYWAEGRTLDVQRRAIAGSQLVIGAYSSDRSQVGFARMVTDLATWAWLCDVFVLPEHQGDGLGTAMVETIVEHPDVADISRSSWRPLMHTNSTHGSGTPHSTSPHAGCTDAAPVETDTALAQALENVRGERSASAAEQPPLGDTAALRDYWHCCPALQRAILGSAGRRGVQRYVMKRQRPIVSKVAVGALGFVGVTAVAGGVEMILFPSGNVFVKQEWLDALPVAGYRLPGLMLGAGIGGGSLVAAFGLVRRPRWRRFAGVERATGMHWAWAATGLVGTTLAGWILLEVAMIPERSAIEALYGAIAVGLVAVCATRSFRRSLRTVTTR